MSDIVIAGWGAVSPAGWGVPALREAVRRNEPLPVKEVTRPETPLALKARAVPPPGSRPSFLGQARLRRTSPIAHYAVAAALEALGPDAANRQHAGSRLGIVYAAQSGCVTYSRRFYSEALKDPATASPLIFPETVFNAPASHLAAMVGTTARNYTLIGDPGTFAQGLAVAADWLGSDQVDGCLVIGAEELDWLVAEAFCLFDPEGIIAEGAGAVYLKRASQGSGGIHLRAVTDPALFTRSCSRAEAARQTRRQLTNGIAPGLLCDSVQGIPRLDHPEQAAWEGWPGGRFSPKRILGEGFMAAAAWQCVAAIDALAHSEASLATVSILGCNQQAIAVQFKTT